MQPQQARQRGHTTRQVLELADESLAVALETLDIDVEATEEYVIAARLLVTAALVALDRGGDGVCLAGL